MVEFRIIVPNYMGKRIEGQWMRDIPYYALQYAAIWIKREVTFTIEFR